MLAEERFAERMLGLGLGFGRVLVTALGPVRA